MLLFGCFLTALPVLSEIAIDNAEPIPYVTPDASDLSSHTVLTGTLPSKASRFRHLQQRARWSFEQVDALHFVVIQADTYLWSEPIPPETRHFLPPFFTRALLWKDTNLLYQQQAVSTRYLLRQCTFYLTNYRDYL